MKEIALHLLDIVQNSVKAGAAHVDIGFALGEDGALVMTEAVMGELKVLLTDDGGLCIEVGLDETNLMSIYFVRAE